ncbi:hypothetical protein CHLNCDRAFT_143184 [Chlorella variabilis]|uniref:C2 domain-containing protein n=1 Tax=Chlorella variabilis TaxID=554065 RepID=E1Z9N1_CHLVA|nr:hypothetical protein CHLNCDRAFT_143184 [Chlorella variabilis]EFN57550.1 hypothetical protein CHLNCDRAFT_143184 [Chlorella variabilis]|eukprot:XP_005849652.1 hypothetical protein CHLNCDRAFT_143184 [Chlorella variabilis]
MQGSAKVGTSITGGSWAGAAAAGQPAELDEREVELPPPPQLPIILPSSAAAVRVKEQQLAGAGGTGGGEDEEEEEEDGDSLDAAADAMAAQQAEQGPGLLQRAVDATSSVAHQAAELAAGAYAAAVPAMRQAVGQTAEVEASGLETAKEAAESVAGAADPEEEEEEPTGSGTSQGLEQPEEAAAAAGPRRPPTVSLAQRAAAAAAAAAASKPAWATAAALPASAGSPAATGQGYFPVVGAVAPAPKPEPRASGALEARHVVAQRLSGLAAEAARHALPQAGPSTPAGRAERGQGADAMDEDWISELVERLWPYIKAAMEEVAWQNLPDILEASEPSWIHDINLKKFVLGEKEPDISDIRVWMDENDVMEDCYLEFAFEWSSRTDVELEIQAWIPNFIEDRLKDMLTFSVGVENAKLRGRIRVTMRPLLRRVPVVGAVQVSLVEQPEFDFDLTLGKSSSVPLEPQLKTWIKQTLQDFVFQTYVIPEHYFLQIDPQAADIQSPVGVLVVEVEEARKVPRMDFFTRSSPYVELYVRDSQRRVTSTKNFTKHPRWGESFELPVHVKEHQELKMSLFDYDWASANDEIGRAATRLSDLEPGQTRDLWLDITSESDKEYQATKGDMKKRDHARAAIAKPLLKQGGKGCQLRIKASQHGTWAPSASPCDDEEKMIKEGQRGGMRQMLDSPQGRQINPHLRRLLMSGTLSVKVVRAEGLSVSSIFGRPSVKARVRCRSQEKELTAVKASRQGCVQYDQPVQLDLGPDATQNPSTEVEVELAESGWFGGDAVGRVRVPLQDVMSQGRIAKGYPLEGGGSQGKVQLELEWKAYF